MSKEIETIRELNASELDQVGGGLSVGAGVAADISSEFNAVHGAIGGALDRIGLTTDGPGAVGAVGGVLGKV